MDVPGLTHRRAQTPRRPEVLQPTGLPAPGGAVEGIQQPGLQMVHMRGDGPQARVVQQRQGGPERRGVE